VGRAGHDPATYGLKGQPSDTEENYTPQFSRGIEGVDDTDQDSSVRDPAPSRDVGAGSDLDLESAIAAAAADRQWDVVKLLAEELRARRLARDGVVDLEQRRQR
jgi:hypothetical protein